MVGYIMLLKMLHCRRNRRLHRRKNGTILSTDSIKNSSKDINIKIEDNGDRTCRACLKNGEISILGSKDMKDISEDFYIITDIKVTEDDEYPKYLCRACHSLLQAAIIFRRTAQLSNENLLNSPPIIQSDHDIGFDKDFETSDSPRSPEPPNKQQENPINFECKRCNLEFLTIEEYSKHRLSQEHENMQHPCPVCNKSYKAIYLKRHLRLHVQEPSYMCDVCGKKCSVKAQFLRHQAIHTSDLPFKCNLCPYRGRFRESLKSHMYSHTGEKPYQCSQCPARFVNKGNLNKHMFTHKQNHDFKCDCCGRGYYTKRELELHIKVDHTGIKEHVCNYCGKVFGYRKQMMKHQLKVHKRQKMKSGRIPLYLQMESKLQEALPNRENT